MKPRSLAVLNYLASHPRPSIREIGEGLGLGTTSVVNYYLDDLESGGLITRGKFAGDHHVARQIELTAEGWRALGKCPVCPTCGRLMGTIA